MPELQSFQHSDRGPPMARDAESLEKLAEQAQTVADEATDDECRRALTIVALGCERLAENARTRRSKEGPFLPLEQSQVGDLESLRLSASLARCG